MTPNDAALQDGQMVDTLAVEMKPKLARARAKGRGGWENPAECSVIDLHRMLLEHACKPNMDFVDVANFAGMLHARLEADHAEREQLAAHLTDLAQRRTEAEGKTTSEELRNALRLATDALARLNADLDAGVILDGQALLEHTKPALAQAEQVLAEADK